jgi:hypothetical protein
MPEDNRMSKVEALQALDYAKKQGWIINEVITRTENGFTREFWFSVPFQLTPRKHEEEAGLTFDEWQEYLNTSLDLPKVKKKARVTKITQMSFSGSFEEE